MTDCPGRHRGRERLSKRFVIRKEKSLKERLVNAAARSRHTRGLLGAAGTSTSTIDAGTHRRPDRPQRLGQEHAAQGDRRHPPADVRARSTAAAGSPRCSSWAPASTPT